jgi:hypothetical protein
LAVDIPVSWHNRTTTIYHPAGIFEKGISTSHVHAPTPVVSVIPQLLLALSSIQIRMWFVRYTASFTYWCKLIYEMVNMKVNDIFNEGVTWLLMKVLWFLMNERPHLTSTTKQMVQ